MRIIGGFCKGQRLFPPDGDEVRPTSDKIRESIFNVLTHNEEWVCLEKASVLDLFAGSGAMGLEALSRGALSAIFVDKSQSALDTIGKNARHLGLRDQSLLLKLDLSDLLRSSRLSKISADVIFLDPPYGKNLIFRTLRSLDALGRLSYGNLCICEMEASKSAEEIENFKMIFDRSYGKIKVCMFTYMKKFKN